MVVPDRSRAGLVYALLERGLPLTYLARLLRVDKGYMSRLVRNPGRLERFLGRRGEGDETLALLRAALLDDRVYRSLLLFLIPGGKRGYGVRFPLSGPPHGDKV